jgi:hypothetical protein
MDLLGLYYNSNSNKSFASKIGQTYWLRPSNSYEKRKLSRLVLISVQPIRSKAQKFPARTINIKISHYGDDALYPEIDKAQTGCRSKIET